MNKRHSLNFGGAIFLVAAVYLMYRVLLHDDILPFAIETVLSSLNHWARHWHILVVGLLPVYVAFMFFGTAIAGIYLGSTLQHFFVKFLINK